MYLSEPYQETKAELLYFLKDRSASLYLYGPVGSGKTSLLRLIAQEVDGDAETNAAYLIAPNLKTCNQLLRLICEHFKVKTERSYGVCMVDRPHRSFSHPLACPWITYDNRYYRLLF